MTEPQPSVSEAPPLLTRSDVTEHTWGVELFAHGRYFGNVVEHYHLTGNGTASWMAYHGASDELGHWPSFDDAVMAVIEAENARRAQEPPRG